MATGLTDTSEILVRGVKATLESWAARLGGSSDRLYWLLRLQLAETGLVDGATVADVRNQVPPDLRDQALRDLEETTAYFDDVRYTALEPITKVWGTVVNSLRVAAASDRATEVQKRVFSHDAASLVDFFRAARDRMEVADELYHAYKAMPAPECQALAALLNVHVDAGVDSDTMCRLVRLLDHEGPMSEAERHDLQSIQSTRLVDAAFRGTRFSG
jgi:hypothetical protein